jgi:hypothetical protein
VRIGRNFVNRTLPVIGLVLATTVGIAGITTAASGAATSHPSSAAAHTDTRGGPGKWTKVTSGTVASISVPSLARTGNGDLHLIYTNKDGARIRHTSIHTNGSIGIQNNVLASDWSTMDYTPVVLGGDGDNLRVLFGGMQSLSPGFWSDGRMYTATSVNAGSGWTLPAQAVGISHSAMSSYGTAGTTLADGTPVAAFPLNNDLTWHVGTGPNADQTETVASCCVYDAAMVRDGSNVWMAWYGNGSTNATNGVFAMQIYPTVGSVLKAPGSSKTSLGSPASIETGRIGLAARAGGGVYAAYCVGYPTCTSVRVWKVGTSTTKDVPGSKAARKIALSAGPSGRLWVAWAGPKVRAVRTGEDGLAMGAVRDVGLPKGQSTAYQLAVDGSRGRGDIVVNVGDSMWHTQVLAGLTLGASPHTWQHGQKQKVVFTVTDAHAPINGAKVKVGTFSCKTGSKGTCAVTFPGSFGKGSHTAKASKSGYAAANTGLRVR